MSSSLRQFGNEHRLRACCIDIEAKRRTAETPRATAELPRA